MRSFSPPLMRLLVIKGVCRAGPPAYVLWSMFEWFRTDWRYGAAFTALTFNYLIVFALTWTAPSLMNGPWRVRPWQTLVLAANAVVLPIAFYRTHGHLPWMFFAALAFCIASLYVGTVIYLKLHERLPNALILSQTYSSRSQPANRQ